MWRHSALFLRTLVVIAVLCRSLATKPGIDFLFLSSSKLRDVEQTTSNTVETGLDLSISSFLPLGSFCLLRQRKDMCVKVAVCGLCMVGSIPLSLSDSYSKPRGSEHAGNATCFKKLVLSSSVLSSMHSAHARTRPVSCVPVIARLLFACTSASGLCRVLHSYQTKRDRQARRVNYPAGQPFDVVSIGSINLFEDRHLLATAAAIRLLAHHLSCSLVSRAVGRWRCGGCHSE